MFARASDPISHRETTTLTPDVTILPSGLRIASVTMPHLHSVSFGISVAAGAVNEPANLNGLAHLLEHMAFKGTERRSARAIAEEVEAVGADINAFTGRMMTSYHMRSLSEHLPLGLDVLSDLLCNSLFDTSELERERGVVLQEIGAAEDTPDDVVFDLLQEAAFPDQSLGRPILGRADCLARVGRDHLKGFMAEHYDAPHMIVTAAGNVDHDRLVELSGDHLSGLPQLRAATAPQAPAYRGGERRNTRALEQAHLTFGFKAPPAMTEGYYETWILNEILGGGMSSRLFQEIREERGLVYSIYSSYRAYPTAGIFLIYAGTAEGDTGEVMRRSAAALHDLTTNVTEAELARAKAQVKAAILMGLESPANVADALATDFLHYGRWVTPEEVIAKIDAIGPEDVQGAARALLAAPLSFAAVGPMGGLENYDGLAAIFGTPAIS
jgi:predicted Zn-dependent peptidase